MLLYSKFVLPGPWPDSLYLGYELSQFFQFPPEAWGSIPTANPSQRNVRKSQVNICLQL